MCIADARDPRRNHSRLCLSLEPITIALRTIEESHPSESSIAVMLLYYVASTSQHFGLPKIGPQSFLLLSVAKMRTEVVASSLAAALPT